MPRFLFASVSAHGHVSPMLPAVAELRARGHEVFFWTGAEHRARVEAAGAYYLPMLDTFAIDGASLDERYPGRSATTGLARLRHDLREVFIARVPAQVEDLSRHIANVEPDILVAEPATAAAAAAIHERVGLPWVTFGITALAMPGDDVPPFGAGLKPMRGPLGRARNKAIAATIDRTIFRAVKGDYEAMAGRLGIPVAEGGIFASTLSPYLYLHPSVPSFEFPRADLPRQVHFVGPHLPPAPPAAQLPSWWDEMLADDRPVVLVTQGTVATDAAELVLPAIEALAGEPVQVVATTGGPDPDAVLAGRTLPANARLERFVPFGDLMPHVAAYVTNGGYGGLHFALANGVPVVSAGKTEDKADLAARVGWSGVGIGIKRQRVRPAQVRRAVRRILDDPRYRARARAMQAEMAGYGGPARSAALLEELYETTVAGSRAAAPALAGAMS